MLSASVSDTQIKRSIFSNVLSLLYFKKYLDTGVVYLISLTFTKMSEHEHFGGLALSDIGVTFQKWQWHLEAQ